MSNFENNCGKTTRHTLSRFTVFFAAAVLFMLSQIAYSQSEDLDTANLAETEQPNLNNKLVVIKKREPDIEKAKEYCRMAIASDNIDTIMKYAALSLEYCQPTDS